MGINATMDKAGDHWIGRTVYSDAWIFIGPSGSCDDFEMGYGESGSANNHSGNQES
jgi:hypothetical protein